MKRGKLLQGLRPVKVKKETVMDT